MPVPWFGGERRALHRADIPMLTEHRPPAPRLQHSWSSPPAPRPGTTARCGCARRCEPAHGRRAILDCGTKVLTSGPVRAERLGSPGIPPAVVGISPRSTHSWTFRLRGATPLGEIRPRGAQSCCVVSNMVMSSTACAARSGSGLALARAGPAYASVPEPRADLVVERWSPPVCVDSSPCRATDPVPLRCTVGSGIRIIHTRHEAAACTWPIAWGRLTEEPGVAPRGTAGPGHLNALSALYGALSPNRVVPPERGVAAGRRGARLSGDGQPRRPPPWPRRGIAARRSGPQQDIAIGSIRAERPPGPCM